MITKVSQKQIQEINPDIKVTISMNTTTGKTGVSVNKPVPALMLAHIMGQCLMQNIEMAVQAQSMLIDPNSKAPVSSGQVLKHDFAQSDSIEENTCHVCGYPSTDSLHQMEKY